MEDTFPWAFIDKVNEFSNANYCEAVQIDRYNKGI